MLWNYKPTNKRLYMRKIRSGLHKTKLGDCFFRRKCSKNSLNVMWYNILHVHTLWGMNVVLFHWFYYSWTSPFREYRLLLLKCTLFCRKFCYEVNFFKILGFCEGHIFILTIFLYLHLTHLFKYHLLCEISFSSY